MISIVVICHNYGRFLRKCLSSIIRADNKVLKEIIIIDDSSTDNTSVISAEFQRNYKKIFFYKKKFKSLSKSTNFAISKSSGTWIAKVDADDYVSKNFISDFVSKIKMNDKANYICTDIICFNEAKKIKFKIKQNFTTKNTFFKYPLGSGSLFKKRLWKTVNGFNENLYYQDDLDFWFKIKKIKKLIYIEKANYFYRKHGRNMSKNIIIKYLTKIYILLKNTI